MERSLASLKAGGQLGSVKSAESYLKLVAKDLSKDCMQLCLNINAHAK